MKTSKNHFKYVMNNIFTSGMNEDYDIEIMRKVIMINIMSVMALTVLLPLGIVDLIKGNFIVGLFVLIVAAVLIFNQIYLRKSGNYMYTIYCGISIVAAYFFYALVTGGVNNTGPLWYFTFPLFTLFLLGPKRGTVATLLLLLSSLLFFSIDTISPLFTTYTTDFKIRFVVSYLVVFGYTYLFETLREKAQRKLSIKNNELMEIVNELKKTEGQLRKSRDKLEERVEERTAEIVKANQELQAEITERRKTEQALLESDAQLQRAQKMEAVGTLAGGVAHDLNNVLSGIVSYPELLLLEIPEDSPLRNPIITIQQSGEKAAAIVQDLLTLARRGVAVKDIVNLNRIITDYLQSPEHENLLSFHPGVHIQTNLDADLLNITGSPAHLTKSVMNLVSNASEAMPKGGEILIATENRYIDKPIRGYDNVEQGNYVTLAVSDSGIGIPSEDMEKIFEPFYTKKKMGRSGTGLGMAVVWGTVKDHNGYIDAHSIKGKGSTFTLYFPVTRKEQAAEKSFVSTEDYKGNGESILVVDDVKEQRDIAARILQELGYTVTTAASGEEAVAYMKDYTADLLILDMIMDPGIDGLETYERILTLKPNQKAIIASGFSETQRVKEAQRLGAGSYVKKPYTLEKIGVAVKEALE